MAITATGGSQSFSYTGSIQTFTVPYDGLYELKLNGASGGSGQYAPTVGNGGTTIQYVPLKKNEVLYIVVGGTGTYGGGNCTYGAITASGGYNGGGSLTYGGDTRNSTCYIAGGGGATHIAKKTGLLKDLENDKDSILAVAGGGGGYDRFGMTWDGAWTEDTLTGGAAGGLISSGTHPASQTSGYAFGQGVQGGGGGWYGGSSSNGNGHVVSGGSSYLSNNTIYTVNGTTYKSSTTSNGTSSGGVNGSATITLIKTGSFSANYEKTFYYTGDIQTFKVPFTGAYKLEVYGAQGGTASYYEYIYAGGKGGYSCGYKNLTKDSVLYVCVGGTATKPEGGYLYTKGGYNGGADGIDNPYSSTDTPTGGGGASHIATVTGTLATIGSSNKSKILIVAGGGGGTWYDPSSASLTYGGAGGGTTGGSSSGKVVITGATQTSGYAFGQGGSAGYCSGGGGGLWGGTSSGGSGGAGGSGYVDGVPSLTYNGKTYSSTTTTGGSDEPYGLVRISSVDNQPEEVNHIAFVGTQSSNIKVGSTNVLDVLGNCFFAKTDFINIKTNLFTVPSTIDFIASNSNYVITQPSSIEGIQPFILYGDDRLGGRFASFSFSNKIDVTNLNKVIVSYSIYTASGYTKKSTEIDTSSATGSGYLTILIRSHIAESADLRPRLEMYIGPTPTSPRTNAIASAGSGVIEDAVAQTASTGFYYYALKDFKITLC